MHYCQPYVYPGNCLYENDMCQQNMIDITIISSILRYHKGKSIVFYFLKTISEKIDRASI